MAREADTNSMEAVRQTRAPRSKRRFHQRIAHRPLCRRAVEGLAQRRAPEPLTPGLRAARAPAWERWSLVLAYGGLVARTLFYLLLFVWAAHSNFGAAALQGVVAADVITWTLLGAARIPFDGLELTVDGVFEFALIVLYLNRDALFRMDGDVEFAGISFLAFLGFASTRLVIWATENAVGAVGN